MTLASLLAIEPKSRMIIESPFRLDKVQQMPGEAFANASRAHSLVT
jgi:hypothetical protein